MKYLSTSPPTSEISYNLVSKNLLIMSSLQKSCGLSNILTDSELHILQKR